ncbi:MAG: putative quinol monooxygenase [Acidimicrobiia bacterium]
MSKTVTIAKLPLKPGVRDDFVKAFNTMFNTVNNEDGTLIYALHLDDSNPDLAWVYELYADEAALVAHGTSEGMKAGMAAFGPFLAEGVELIRATPVSAKGFDV